MDHKKLMELVETRIKDPLVLKLIREGLKCKIFESYCEAKIQEPGTPPGGILSPLLSNIYLDAFDK